MELKLVPLLILLLELSSVFCLYIKEEPTDENKILDTGNVVHSEDDFVSIDDVSNDNVKNVVDEPSERVKKDVSGRKWTREYSVVWIFVVNGDSSLKDIFEKVQHSERLKISVRNDGIYGLSATGGGGAVWNKVSPVVVFLTCGTAMKNYKVYALGEAGIESLISSLGSRTNTYSLSSMRDYSKQVLDSSLTTTNVGTSETYSTKITGELVWDGIYNVKVYIPRIVRTINVQAKNDAARHKSATAHKEYNNIEKDSVVSIKHRHNPEDHDYGTDERDCDVGQLEKSSGFHLSGGQGTVWEEYSGNKVANVIGLSEQQYHAQEDYSHSDVIETKMDSSASINTNRLNNVKVLTPTIVGTSNLQAKNDAAIHKSATAHKEYNNNIEKDSVVSIKHRHNPEDHDYGTDERDCDVGQLEKSSGFHLSGGQGTVWEEYSGNKVANVIGLSEQQYHAREDYSHSDVYETKMDSSSSINTNVRNTGTYGVKLAGEQGLAWNELSGVKVILLPIRSSTINSQSNSAGNLGVSRVSQTKNTYTSKVEHNAAFESLTNTHGVHFADGNLENFGGNAIFVVVLAENSNSFANQGSFSSQSNNYAASGTAQQSFLESLSKHNFQANSANVISFNDFKGSSGGYYTIEEFERLFGIRLSDLTGSAYDLNGIRIVFFVILS